LARFVEKEEARRCHMKRIAIALTITALTIPLLGLTSSAEAAGGRHGKHYDRGHDSWHAQTSFRVGDFNFSLGYNAPARGSSHHYQPRYYYRTSSEVNYRGYQCDSSCYKRKDHYYHTPSCPLVRQHFRVFRYLPPPLPYYYSPYGAEGYYYPPQYRYERRSPYRYRSYRRGW